jgi:hypothetical protein
VSDLWSFDLRSRSWRQVAQPCTGGLCPPLVPNAALVFDEVSHRARVVLGRSDEPYEDHTWSFAAGEGWSSASGFARDQARDCDDDGAPDPGHGVLCQSASDWWAPLGAFRCGPDGLTCSALGTPGAEAGRVRAPGALDLADGGVALLVLRPRSLETYDLRDPAAPALASSLRLGDRARDLEPGPDGRAFVAAGRAVEVLDLSEPLAPARIGRLLLRHEPRGLVFVGPSTLVATMRDGLAVVDLSDPAAPELASFLWLRRGRAGWESLATDGRPPRRGWSHAGPGPRAIARSGTVVVVGAGRDLLTVDLSTPLEPELLGTLRLDEPIRRLRASGSHMYLTSAGREDAEEEWDEHDDEEVSWGAEAWEDDGAGIAGSLVVEISQPEEPVVASEHEVGDWVRGTLWHDGWAYRLDACGVEIARVGR